jgi:hypothetical protein
MKPIDRLWPGGRALEPAVLEGDREQDPGSDPGAARYDVNPQLAVIESYVLDVIGELSPEEVEEAENAVAGLFGEASDWRGRVRKQLGWNALVDAVIADRWHRFRKSAMADGGDPEPAEFARRFADDAVRLSRS